MVESLVGSASHSGEAQKVDQVIDVDVHETFKSVEELLPYLNEPWSGLIERGCWKAPVAPFAYWTVSGPTRADAVPEDGSIGGTDLTLMREQLLDLYPIRNAVLTGYFFPANMKGMQTEFASALASAYNDYEIDQWLEKDDRLLGSIHIAPQDPQSAAREIDRVGGHPQMVQVMLAITTESYGDPKYFPIFEAAQQNDLRIATHQTFNTQGACGMGRYYVERHSLVPQATMAQVIGLMFSGVFEKLPKLRFMALEGGWTWLPHVLWRMDREYRELYLEVPWLKRRPSEYLTGEDRRFRFAIQPTEDINSEQFVKVLELIGDPGVLVFATDYPHFDFDSPDRALPPRLPRELVSRIKYDNAAEFYGIA